MTKPTSNVGGLTTELDGAEETPRLLGEHVYLLVRQAGAVRVLPIDAESEVTVGRDPGTTVVVEHSRVSRNHARIAHRGGNLVLTDLGSRNGTFVSGTLVRGAERLLYGGDVVVIGDAELVVATASRLPAARESRGRQLETEETADDSKSDLDRWVVAEEAMVKLHGLVQKLARAPTAVLVIGETGVGKEVIAERLHSSGPRARGPFITVNCAAIPEALFESELFGHERGAFTGADRKKAGLFEAAHGGTLLLDEVGELPASMQAKLLRALESRTVTRLGDVRPIKLDVRVICATHKDLKGEVEAGHFREDLYYRISAFTIRVPPLRERPVEIGLLAHLFSADLAAQMNLPAPSIDKAALDALQTYGWPGNVRELRNAVEHAVVIAEGPEIRVEHLPEDITSIPKATGMRDRVEDVERANIEAALQAAGGNQTRAAAALGVSRRTLIYKIAKYGLRQRT